jgi:hypothetical protein
MPSTSNPFNFVAFDNVSQAILSHGASIEEAVAAAGGRNTRMIVHVLAAGNRGQEIWRLQLNLFAAREMLEARGISSLCVFLDAVDQRDPVSLRGRWMRYLTRPYKTL